MAGIYIHVPFCTKKCGYCDFYSITQVQLKEKYVDALLQEFKLRSNELIQESVETIYFGGGTPSLLSKKDLKNIFDTLKSIIDFKMLSELTIEVNPDDLSLFYLNNLREIGFNRISIGIQSFNDEILRFMNRRHDARQAIEGVELAKQAGFTNISIDLIYGIPGMSLQCWKDTVDQALALRVQHISAYHLTFEPNTPFFTLLKAGNFKELPDEDSIKQFQILKSKLKANGFIDYEISNFCLPGIESRHNSNYWTGKTYVGFGPSAHSYASKRRRWNVSDLHRYIQGIDHKREFSDMEYLTEKDQYNETIMLGLRTKRGIDLVQLKHDFSIEIGIYFKEEMHKQILANNVVIEGDFLQVTEEKKMMTDQIISDFFKV
jgi:oxygen-independent coproporphyrinogen-3 oxidase